MIIGFLSKEIQPLLNEKSAFSQLRSVFNEKEKKLPSRKTLDFSLIWIYLHSEEIWILAKCKFTSSIRGKTLVQRIFDFHLMVKLEK